MVRLLLWALGGALLGLFVAIRSQAGANVPGGTPEFHAGYWLGYIGTPTLIGLAIGYFTRPKPQAPEALPPKDTTEPH